MLKELIDQFYLDREKAREQHHFYITDAGKCSRAIFFKFKNVPREKMTPEILRMFDHGNYVQMQILNTLFGLGVVRASEVNIPPQELISGRADAIITLKNELYVVDFKSMNSIIFSKLEAAKEENINQIQLYMHFFKIPNGILLYVNKNTLELKEFYINYDPIRCQRLLDDLTALRTKIEANIIPLRLPDYSTNWQCRYCQFKEICKIANTEELSWERFKNKVQEREGLPPHLISKGALAPN